MDSRLRGKDGGFNNAPNYCGRESTQINQVFQKLGTYRQGEPVRGFAITEYRFLFLRSDHNFSSHLAGSHVLQRQWCVGQLVTTGDARLDLAFGQPAH